MKSKLLTELFPTQKGRTQKAEAGPPRRIMEMLSCCYHLTSIFISFWWIITWAARANEAAEGRQAMRARRHCSTGALLKEQGSKLGGQSLEPA